jgi:hypothetical protein
MVLNDILNSLRAAAEAVPVLAMLVIAGAVLAGKFILWLLGE